MSTAAGEGAIRQEVRATLALSWPLAGAFAGNQLLSLVDTVVAGHLGTVQIAAVGLGGSLFFVGTILGVGILMGLDPLASQAVGADEPHLARRYLREGIRLALVLSIPAVGLVVGLLYGALAAAGVEVETRAEVARYLLGRAPSALALLLFTALRAYLQAVERTRPVLMGMVVANVLNVPVSLLLAFSAGLGVLGIGLASSLVMFAQVAVLAETVRRIPAPEGTGRPTREGTARLVEVGWPVGMHYLAEMGVFATVTVLMGSLGTVAVGGHQVALQLAAFTFTVCLGVSAATSVRVGHAVGRGDPEGTRRAGLVGLGVGTVFMTSTAVCFLLFARPLAVLVANTEEVVAAAVPLLHIAAAFQIFDGLQAVASGALRGAGDTRTSMVFTVIGHWFVGLPVGVACAWGFDLGPVGLWIGLTVGLATAGVSLTVRFLRVVGHVSRV